MKKILGRIILVCLLAASLSGVILMTVNNHVVNSTRDRILHIDNGTDEPLSDEEKRAMTDINADCIMVLGAGIKDVETPTPMLKDRLDTAVKLYREGVAPKILLTGDNGTREHNELHVMLKYMKDAGISEENIFCDHAGFSTYDSVYRAKDIFGVKKMIIITQSYHLYRSLYIADKLDIEAAGAAADQTVYRGQYMRELREVAARIKDYFKCIKGAEALVGGESIPISGSGVISHGE